MESIVDVLPNDIIYNILLELDPVSLHQVFQVRRFSVFANDEYFWHQKIKHDYGDCPQLAETWKATWILLLTGVRFTYQFATGTSQIDTDHPNEELEYTPIPPEKIDYAKNIINISIEEVISFLSKGNDKYGPTYISDDYIVNIRDLDFDVILKIRNLNSITYDHISYIAGILGEFIYINIDSDDNNEKTHYTLPIDDLEEDDPVYNDYIKYFTIDGFTIKWSKIRDDLV
jgi:hypothetical protein